MSWIRRLFGGSTEPEAPADPLDGWRSLIDGGAASFDGAEAQIRLARAPAAERLLVLRRWRERLPDHAPLLRALAELGGEEAEELWGVLAGRGDLDPATRGAAERALADAAEAGGRPDDAATHLQRAAAHLPEDGALLQRALRASRHRPRLPDAALRTAAQRAEAVLDLPPIPDRLPAGLVLGRRLGSGTFGVVHAARDTALGRGVAVKLLHPHLAADPRRVRAFTDEARLLAKLGHPGVVYLYDIDVVTHAIVMELCPEGSLRDRLSVVGRFEPADALDLVRRLLEILADLHPLGVVHGDLKPENLLFRAGRSLALGDFGVGAALAGTPGYRAPEQAGGGPPDPRHDVHAVGRIWLELLSGVPPEAGVAPERGLVPGAVPAAGTSDDSTLSRPGALPALALAMCEPDPAERPADAGVALSALV